MTQVMGIVEALRLVQERHGYKLFKRAIARMQTLLGRILLKNDSREDVSACTGSHLEQNMIARQTRLG